MKFPHPVAFCLLSLVVTGCRHVPPPSNGAAWTPPPFVTPSAGPTVALKLPPLPELDFSRMEGDAFIPPGATVIWPDPRITVEIRLTARGKYPSTAESVARDGNAVVGSRSSQEFDHLRHWLRVYRRGEAQARNIFQTNNSFETLWSYDSRALAVSHFTGKNTAEVLVYRLGDAGGVRPVELRAALSPYFSEAQLTSPRFNKAYRWSDGSQLIIRGIGRLASEPYDLF
ncbi:MAG: hypothetical protein NTV51_29845 [Verrucomicrobia bacterium]|nr:hypothetical protein [Verrucomicrobiota bacterium]